METAQKRAVLAILGMIESGILQLKMLLSADGPEDRVIGDVPRPSAASSQLDDEEELMLERQLEEERLRLVNFEKKRAEAIWNQGDTDVPTMPWSDDE